jgi:apolipoprotein N-acyltransferase
MIANVIVAAFLFYLSFPNGWSPHGLWPLAWIALVPFFVSLDGQSLKKRIWLGVFYGIVSYGLLLQWLWPVHWAGTVLFVLAMAIQPVVFVLFYRTISHPLWGCIYVPALWVASEWMRTVFLKGFCWGLGYSQSFEPALIQLASLTGPYGVSFVIVFVNYCLVQSFQIPLKRKMYIGLALGMFLVIYAAGTWSIRTHEKETPSLLVCAIQPNISPVKKLSLKDFDDNIQSQVALTEKALSGRRADIIVWPETTFPADVFKDDVWYPRLRRIAVENGAVFMFGAVPIIEEKSFNSTVIFDQKGEVVGIHHKQFLVPISEYRPGWISFGFLKGIFNAHGFDFTPGKQQDVFTVV